MVWSVSILVILQYACSVLTHRLANDAKCVADVPEVAGHGYDVRVVVAGGEGTVGHCQQAGSKGLHTAVRLVDVVADGVGALTGAVVQSNILQTSPRNRIDEVVGWTNAEGSQEGRKEHEEETYNDL